MRQIFLSCLTFGSLVLCPWVQAGEWFELGGFGNEASADAPSDTLLETDLQAFRARGAQRSLLLRLSFRPPRQAKGHAYRSLEGTLVISCDSADAVWKEVRLFSEEKAQGELLEERLFASAHGSGLPLAQTDWLPPGGWHLLRKSACASVATLAP